MSGAKKKIQKKKIQKKKSKFCIFFFAKKEEKKYHKKEVSIKILFFGSGFGRRKRDQQQKAGFLTNSYLVLKKMSILDDFDSMDNSMDMDAEDGAKLAAVFDDDGDDLEDDLLAMEEQLQAARRANGQPASEDDEDEDMDELNPFNFGAINANLPEDDANSNYRIPTNNPKGINPKIPVINHMAFTFSRILMRQGQVVTSLMSFDDSEMGKRAAQLFGLVCAAAMRRLKPEKQQRNKRKRRDDDDEEEEDDDPEESEQEKAERKRREKGGPDALVWERDVEVGKDDNGLPIYTKIKVPNFIVYLEMVYPERYGEGGFVGMRLHVYETNERVRLGREMQAIIAANAMRSGELPSGAPSFTRDQMNAHRYMQVPTLLELFYCMRAVVAPETPAVKTCETLGGGLDSYAIPISDTRHPLCLNNFFSVNDIEMLPVGMESTAKVQQSSKSYLTRKLDKIEYTFPVPPAVTLLTKLSSTVIWKSAAMPPIVTPRQKFRAEDIGKANPTLSEVARSKNFCLPNEAEAKQKARDMQESSKNSEDVIKAERIKNVEAYHEAQKVARAQAHEARALATKRFNELKETLGSVINKEMSEEELREMDEERRKLVQADLESLQLMPKLDAAEMAKYERMTEWLRGDQQRAMKRAAMRKNENRTEFELQEEQRVLEERLSISVEAEEEYMKVMNRFFLERIEHFLKAYLFSTPGTAIPSSTAACLRIIREVMNDPLEAIRMPVVAKNVNPFGQVRIYTHETCAKLSNLAKGPMQQMVPGLVTISMAVARFHQSLAINPLQSGSAMRGKSKAYQAMMMMMPEEAYMELTDLTPKSMAAMKDATFKMVVIDEGNPGMFDSDLNSIFKSVLSNRKARVQRLQKEEDGAYRPVIDESELLVAFAVNSNIQSAVNEAEGTVNPLLSRFMQIVPLYPQTEKNSSVMNYMARDQIRLNPETDERGKKLQRRAHYFYALVHLIERIIHVLPILDIDQSTTVVILHQVIAEMRKDKSLKVHTSERFQENACNFTRTEAIQAGVWSVFLSEFADLAEFEGGAGINKPKKKMTPHSMARRVLMALALCNVSDNAVAETLIYFGATLIPINETAVLRQLNLLHRENAFCDPPMTYRTKNDVLPDQNYVVFKGNITKLAQVILSSMTSEQSHSVVSTNMDFHHVLHALRVLRQRVMSTVDRNRLDDIAKHNFGVLVTHHNEIHLLAAKLEEPASSSDSNVLREAIRTVLSHPFNKPKTVVLTGSYKVNDAESGETTWHMDYLDCMDISPDPCSKVLSLPNPRPMTSAAWSTLKIPGSSLTPVNSMSEFTNDQLIPEDPETLSLRNRCIQTGIAFSPSLMGDEFIQMCMNIRNATPESRMFYNDNNPGVYPTDFIAADAENKHQLVKERATYEEMVELSTVMSEKERQVYRFRTAGFRDFHSFMPTQIVEYGDNHYTPEYVSLCNIKKPDEGKDAPSSDSEPMQGVEAEDHEESMALVSYSRSSAVNFRLPKASEMAPMSERSMGSDFENVLKNRLSEVKALKEEQKRKEKEVADEAFKRARLVGLARAALSASAPAGGHGQRSSDPAWERAMDEGPSPQGNALNVEKGKGQTFFDQMRDRDSGTYRTNSIASSWAAAKQAMTNPAPAEAPPAARPVPTRNQSAVEEKLRQISEIFADDDDQMVE